MSRFALIRALLVVAVCAMSASVWLAAESQRSAASSAFDELGAAHDLLTAMLDQETGLRGFALTRQSSFLEPHHEGRRRVEIALLNAHRSTQGDPAVAAQEALVRRWQRLAERDLEIVRSGRPIPPENAAVRKGVMDRFRSVNREHSTEVREKRDRNQRRAGLFTVGLIVLLGVLFGGLGYLLVERRSRMDERRRVRQSAFKEAMQVARSEPEAYGVLKTHLESWLPDGEAVVLNRNNSADELEARTPLPPASPLNETLPGAEPDGCLAIRAGRVYSRAPDGKPLLSCEVCSAVGRPVTCVPSLVGGEVIGSVLVEHGRRLKPAERAELETSVSEAAPLIGNLRNVVIAEMRAVTDALTGLANTRAVHETAKRMAAQASRTLTPLAAVLFDLDHFKQINDTYGHAKGDDVLAAVGDALAHSIRDSDFVGRYGGEEFLALLPDTDAQGAVRVAEKLRQTIASVRVEELGGRLSASFGVAVLPDHAGEVDQLLRCADRALYLAKSNGRDRVELFEAPLLGGTAPHPPESS
jgi:diguanylate cyclase (GGDEF)-like protein